MSCACPQPLPSSNPRNPDTCNRCGKRVDPEWASNDETVTWFFDRLAEGAFPGKPPPSFERFREQCVARERHGRNQFGLKFLVRDNPAEACEEAADLANYGLFDVLVARRRGEDDELDLALTMALHAFKAHEAACRLRAKRHGAP